MFNYGNNNNVESFVFPNSFNSPYKPKHKHFANVVSFVIDTYQHAHYLHQLYSPYGSGLWGASTTTAAVSHGTGSAFG